MNVFPVILCGGAGTRLWPASRSTHPKQFLQLVGGRSSFQNTLSRLRGLANASPPVIVAGAGHLAELESALWDLSREAIVLVEPTPRNTAAAIAVAMRWIEAQDPNGVAAVLASDHHVDDEAAFRDAIEAAVLGASRGHIATLGIRPDRATSAYGYIEVGETLDGSPLHRVALFVEKPEPEAAQDLITRGALWNSGNFVATARILIDELGRAAPEVLDAASVSLAQARATGQVIRLSQSYAEAPNISFDYAVMEKTARAAVLPVSFGWSDLGAWDAVWAASEKSAEGNVLSGACVIEDTRDCLIRAAPGQLITTAGIRNLAVIAEADAVLVCDLAASQAVRNLAGRVEASQASGSRAAFGDTVTRLERMGGEFRQWLDFSALPLWWALGADHHGGGFYEAIDEAGPKVDAARRSRVQTRQTFVFAKAGALGWQGPWREAMAHGVGYCDKAYRRADGLHRTLVDRNGEPLDDTPWLYDQAFALLALAEQGVGREADAIALMSAIDGAFRLPRSGYAELSAPRFVSNPMMHLFEAVLAWVEIGGDASWRGRAEELATFAVDTLFDATGGYIAEVYDPLWRAAIDPGDRQMSPGHQFEWAWLLARWSGLGGGDPPLAVARRLYAAGGRGIHPRNRVVMNALHTDFQVIDPAARLWPQAEWLKAAHLLMTLASGDEAEALRVDVLAAGAALWRYVQTPVRGLWRDVVDDAGVLLPGPAPATSLYHLICAIGEVAPGQRTTG